jgi:8-oxo-dGTP diphosphatase
MINATACYIHSEGKTLFLYRNGGKEDIHHKKYVPPGGRNEPGERSVDCVVREVEEETGLHIKDPKLRMIVTFDNRGRVLGKDASPQDWCVHIYEATDFTGTLRRENALSEPEWITDSLVHNIRMHEGDHRIWGLLHAKGLFEVIVKYDKERLVTFEYVRV